MNTDATALSTALAVLTAMITPAVLITACGSLILSTSTRLGRVVDRVRALSEKFEEMAHEEQASNLELYEERRVMIYGQLDRLTSRARLLQRAMTIFYLALGVFVFCSVLIGLVSVLNEAYWVPVVTGLCGAGLLFYGSLLLILEARHALTGIHAEMDFIWKLGKHIAPEELRAKQSSSLNRKFKQMLGKNQENVNQENVNRES